MSSRPQWWQLYRAESGRQCRLVGPGSASRSPGGLPRKKFQYEEIDPSDGTDDADPVETSRGRATCPVSLPGRPVSRSVSVVVDRRTAGVYKGLLWMLICFKSAQDSSLKGEDEPLYPGIGADADTSNGASRMVDGWRDGTGLGCRPCERYLPGGCLVGAGGCLVDAPGVAVTLPGVLPGVAETLPGVLPGARPKRLPGVAVTSPGVAETLPGVLPGVPRTLPTFPGLLPLCPNSLGDMRAGRS